MEKLVNERTHALVMGHVGLTIPLGRRSARLAVESMARRSVLAQEPSEDSRLKFLRFFRREARVRRLA